MTRRTPTPKHFPARADTTGDVTTYTALCGHTSQNTTEFCNPARPEQTTCQDCRNYDRLKSAEQWTQAIQMERE